MNNNCKITNCIVCGKPLRKKQIYNNQKCCSPQCSAKNPERKEKMSKTVKERYGVSHFSKSKNFKNKIKETWKNKNNEEVDLMNQQLEETNLKKYGCKRPLQNNSIKEKMKQTNLKKYGTDNVFASEEIKKKCRRLFLKKSFYTLKERLKNDVIPMFTEQEYEGINHKIYKWKCVKCGNIFEQHVHITQMNGEKYFIPRCLKCYPYIAGSSYVEQDIFKFIKSIYKGKIVQNNKFILHGYELDIYLPEKKIAIELNGNYWHSVFSGADKKYHVMKTELCEKNGIQLIHIFEHQWYYKKDIVKQKLKAIINNDMERVYARKCNINEIDVKTSNEFLEKYHIQGKDNSSIRYGLYYKNELVAVMTFGRPRFNKKYDFELIRYATNKHVIGGASKLLNYFVKQHVNASIITYADRCWSKGNMYKKIGFKLIGKSQPNYIYTKNNIILNRYQCQKHKLKDILKDKFNPELSESENMRLNNYNKIYDCGNLIFVYNKGEQNEHTK